VKKNSTPAEVEARTARLKAGMDHDARILQDAVRARIARNAETIAQFHRAVDALELDTALAEVEYPRGLGVIRDPQRQALIQFRQALDAINREVVAQYGAALDAVEHATKLHPVVPSELLIPTP
jgi:hypothetical protein